jgi:hypothetical protein
MTTAPEPAPEHTRAPMPVPADDPAGRLLAALLATAGLAEQLPEPAVLDG